MHNLFENVSVHPYLFVVKVGQREFSFVTSDLRPSRFSTGADANKIHLSSITASDYNSSDPCLAGLSAANFSSPTSKVFGEIDLQ